MWRKQLLMLGLGVVLLILAIDLVCEAFEEAIYPVFPSSVSLTGKPSGYSIKATLKELDYVSSSKTLRSKLHLEVTADSPEEEIESVSFSLGKGPSGSAFVRIERSDFIRDSEIHLGPEEPLLSWAYLHYDVELPMIEERRALFYPFDRRSFSIEPRMCVNDVIGSCFDHDQQNVDSFQIPSLAIDFSSFYRQQDICDVEVKDGVVDFSLCRDSFLRWISVYFLVVVLVFVGYMLWAEQPRETMAKALGLFAALWGLRQMLVPRDFEQFPTIVDYVIFLIYSVLFAIILVRIQSNKGDSR